MKYARGDRAWGRCQRCGDRKLLSDLSSDGYEKGLMVCGPCWDEYPPSLKPFNADEGIILKHPTGDGEDDSVGMLETEEGDGSLATAMGFTNSFGGGT